MSIWTNPTKRLPDWDAEVEVILRSGKVVRAIASVNPFTGKLLGWVTQPRAMWLAPHEVTAWRTLPQLEPSHD